MAGKQRHTGNNFKVGVGENVFTLNLTSTGKE